MSKATTTAIQKVNPADLARQMDARLLTDNEAFDAFFEQAARVDSEALHEENSLYLRFDEWAKGESKDFVCIGVGQVVETDNGKKPAVLLLDEERNQWIAASSIVVNVCNRLAEKSLPFFVRVTYNGKKKGKNGEYYDISIKSL